MSSYGEPKRQTEAAAAVVAALGSGSGTQVDVAIAALNAVVGKLGKRKLGDVIREEQMVEEAPRTPAPVSCFDAVVDDTGIVPTTPAPVFESPSSSHGTPGSGPNSGSRRPTAVSRTR